MKILAKDGKIIKLNGGAILPPSAAGSDVNIQYDVIDTSFFERNESDGSVTINLPTTANNWALIVQGVGVVTDFITGVAPTKPYDSCFMMSFSFDSHDTYNNVLYCACDNLLESVDNYTGISHMSIQYKNNKYQLLNVIDIAKSNYFIWTVTSILNSVLITWQQ